MGRIIRSPNFPSFALCRDLSRDLKDWVSNQAAWEPFGRRGATCVCMLEPQGDDGLDAVGSLVLCKDGKGRIARRVYVGLYWGPGGTYLAALKLGRYCVVSTRYVPVTPRGSDQAFLVIELGGPGWPPDTNW